MLSKPTKTTKIFLSHNMSGLDDEEVRTIRFNALATLNHINKDNKYGKIEIIENYSYPDAPENAHRLWYLGKSIQKIAESDYIYFCEPNASSKGCIVEKFIATLYDIPVIKIM